MLTAQKYIDLRTWEDHGANLAPVDFDEMDKFEKKYNLQKIKGNRIIQVPRRELKHKLARLLR